MLQSLNRSQKFWNKERDEKELNQVHKFESACILLMNSHLTLSLRPIYSTPFPLITHIYVVGFIWSFWESLVLPRFYKWDVIKKDKLLMVLPRLVKKVIGKQCYIKEGKEKNTHTWDRWTCANGKEWSWGTKEVLVIGLHMVGKWVWIF
jgi:hypothetical protein